MLGDGRSLKTDEGEGRGFAVKLETEGGKPETAPPL